MNKVEEQLRAARAEAYQQLEAQRRESQTARHVLIAEIKAEAVQQVTAAKEEIAKQAVEAQQNLETEARAMAATISSQILHRPVSAGGN